MVGKGVPVPQLGITHQAHAARMSPDPPPHLPMSERLSNNSNLYQAGETERQPHSPTPGASQTGDRRGGGNETRGRRGKAGDEGHRLGQVGTDATHHSGLLRPLA